MAQKKIEACLVCGEPLVYYETAREMTCVYCGGTFPSNAACEAGHFVCDACHSRKAVENILAYCGSCESRDPVAIAKALRADPFVHMHGPEHHVLVGAALLTAYRNSGGQRPYDIYSRPGTVRVKTHGDALERPDATKRWSVSLGPEKLAITGGSSVAVLSTGGTEL